jgi:hypothetical protein
MAIAVLSWPTTASCDSGSMRMATLFAKSRCSIDIGFLRMRRDRARQDNDADRDQHQQADHHAERIDEVRVLLAHI